MAKSIIVPRGADNDGPFRAAVAGDRVRVPRVAFTPFTVAGQPVNGAGGLGYCSDGDAGARVGCCHDGSVWRRLALGSEVALGIEIYSMGYTGERFHVLTGDPTALTNSINACNPPGAAGGPSLFHALGATPDGATIWVGGAYWGADIDLANTFWRSINGGTTWTNQAATHPNAQNGEIYSIFAVDDTLFACGINFGSTAKILKWNSGTTSWDSVYDYGANWRANCLWGTSASNMYCISYNGGALRLTSNVGGAWAAEGASANNLDNVLGGADPVAICGDSTGRLFVWAYVDAPSGYYVYTGTFNGNDWAQDARVWDAGRQFPGWGFGRNIMQDETDAIWLTMFESATGDVEVYRRDPTTGLWTLMKDFNDGWMSGTSGSLWVVDSSCLVVGGAGFMGVYFEGVWTTYQTGTFASWTDGSHQPGLWARRLV